MNGEEYEVEGYEERKRVRGEGTEAKKENRDEEREVERIGRV